VLENGGIVDQGVYADLSSKTGPFSRLLHQNDNIKDGKDGPEDMQEKDTEQFDLVKPISRSPEKQLIAEGKGKVDGRLTVPEGKKVVVR
jgi:hypothetical protein